MTKEQKQQYRQTNDLREALEILKKGKYKLDCGHYCTFNEVLGNNITIYNGKELRITCAECGY